MMRQIARGIGAAALIALALVLFTVAFVVNAARQIFRI